MENYGHRTATTVNGVVINIQGDSHTTKVGGKRVRRDASFRVPPPASFNGAGRASSPTLSSASGSPYPASANAPPMNNVPVESVRARALQAVEFYNSSVLAPNNNNSTTADTYKSLGDVFGIQAAVSSLNGKMGHARSVTDVYKHVPMRAHSSNGGPAAHAHHRVSTYSNVSVPVNSSSSSGSNRFGTTDMRASYNEQRRIPGEDHRRNYPQRSIVYKSNSSLDLDHEVQVVQEAVSSVNLNAYNSHQMARQFGSQGSINDLKSFEGPAAMSTLQRRPMSSDVKSEVSSVLSDTSSQSPKVNKKKSGGLLNAVGGKNQNKSGLFKKFKVNTSSSKSEGHSSGVIHGHGGTMSNTSAEGSSCDGISQSAERQSLLDDRHRRRFFSHYDIGSLCASLSISVQLKNQEKRNTGASAASAALRGIEDSNNEDTDQGDHVSNELVLSCPYFRNEVGGEMECSVALTRGNGNNGAILRKDENQTTSTHTPTSARGFCLFDSVDTYWNNGYCPYEPNNSYLSHNVIERIDSGSHYYKKHFYGQDHQNWFGIDDHLGALAVSIRREKVPLSSTNGSSSNGHHSGETQFIQPRNIDPDKDYGKDQWMYRLLVRTSDLLPIRGCVLEESIPALRSEKIKSLPTKEVLEFACPELQLSSLHLGIQSGPCEDELIRLDEAYVQNRYKVGLMYCGSGQQTEEEMYNNEEGSSAFNEFLEILGQKVRLKGFTNYKAGLCNKNDSTGLYSVYAEHQANELMFHVSTLLPFTPNNRQQLPRKRYIGNDIVTVVFQESDAKPFIPNLKSQFQHVFIVVRSHGKDGYAVAVSRAKSVPMFGPPLPSGGLFKKDKAFAEFLLTKIINAENAAHLSDKFVGMAIRTRKELLKDLATNYVTQTTLDSGSRFGLFTSAKKKDKTKPRFTPDCAGLKGALSWRVVAEDCSSVQTTVRSHSREVDAVLGISPDSIILIQDNAHHDVLFLTATKAVIGWTALQNSIRIYFHQGEAIILHSKDWESEDMSEISQRLKAVTNGAPTQEFTLRRNQLGQLGFHVQHDGLITEVENFGYAWQTGLRQGSRLVEICKHPVTALTHEQMVDLLKTSMTVIVTVIPPHPDGTPRKGCHLLTCPHAFGQNSNSTKTKSSDSSSSGGGNGNTNGDYENIHHNASNNTSTTGMNNPSQQTPSGDKTVFDHQQRSLSPPRSSNSSGYGTGSSRKSSTVLNHQYNQKVNLIPNNNINNNNHNSNNSISSSTSNQIPSKTDIITNHSNGLSGSTSSGNSGDERWYDFGDHPHSSSENSPPPLPNRLLGGKGSAFHKVNNTSSVVISGNSVLSNAVATANGHNSSSNSANSSPSIYQHPPPPKMVMPKQQHRQCEPQLQQQHPPQQQTDKRLARKYSYPIEEKREARVTYLTEYELTNQSSSSPSNVKHSKTINGIKPIDPDVDSNHRSRGQRSEDELSAVSTISASSNMSPHTRRRLVRQATNGTPSSGSSRNESPRFATTANGTRGGGGDPNESQYGVVKLKKSAARHNPNRNSTSFQTSTLQEDLLKLIGQDYDKTTPKSLNKEQNQPLRSRSTSQQHMKRSKSRETLTNEDSNSPDSQQQPNYMARPATVISNTSGSSAASNISGNSNNLFTSPTSPARKPSSALPLPDSHSMDWNSLVNTATKAINTDEDETTLMDLESEQPTQKSTSSTKEAIPAEERLSQLLERLESLEHRLNSESRQKSELADEVAQLREENQRLQEESATAAQQLRRFTEWFFQTIEKT